MAIALKFLGVFAVFRHPRVKPALLQIFKKYVILVLDTGIQWVNNFSAYSTGSSGQAGGRRACEKAATTPA